MTRLLLLVAILSTMTSCLYKMPTDDDMSTMPTTNNPRVVRDDPGLSPGVEF